MKNRREKRVGVKLNKRKYCVGTEPSALAYIGILVTSAHWLVHLLHKQKVGGSIPSCGKYFFFSPSIFLPYLSNLLYNVRPSK